MSRTDTANDIKSNAGGKVKSKCPMTQLPSRNSCCGRLVMRQCWATCTLYCLLLTPFMPNASQSKALNSAGF